MERLHRTSANDCVAQLRSLYHHPQNVGLPYLTRSSPILLSAMARRDSRGSPLTETLPTGPSQVADSNDGAMVVSTDLPAVSIIDAPVVDHPPDSVESLNTDEDTPHETHIPAVVLSGETPGPQIALSTIEPAAVEQASIHSHEADAAADEPAEKAPETAEPIIHAPVDEPAGEAAEDKEVKKEEEESSHPNGNGVVDPTPAVADKDETSPAVEQGTSSSPGVVRPYLSISNPPLSP
ncbi:hypothetical protein HGRIS_005427 [Hohenbuehelia grisea]|uniref:Uncharacterized protein n=1 Tax=Hohenbuehelia grisea TaxID=104357 RepID=A0ABR3JZ47_9AGAR